MVSDKWFTLLLELVQLYKTKPIREIFHFHYLPELYIGFNVSQILGLNLVHGLKLAQNKRDSLRTHKEVQ